MNRNTVSIKINPSNGQKYLATKEKGWSLLLNPLTNKGTAFSLKEREELDLEGLVPPAVETIEAQIERAYSNYSAKSTLLEKFIYLSSLQDRNEVLFYRLLGEHIEEMMPVIYTPVVGEACQKFSHIYRRPRGLFINYEQKDNIEKILRSSGYKPSVIVVTDGERILGLGDQGIGGMGIPIGKLCLYTLCAGISPYKTLPITLDVGTDNPDLLADPLYLGLRHKRIRGNEYQDFIDAFVLAVKNVFPDVILQWEDFLKGNAIKQLHRFRKKICSFNDDIQGTAGVVIAGLLGALKITKNSMKTQRFLFAGAGAAAQGIADLIVEALCAEGLSREEARKLIWTVDSKGLVTKDRENLDEFKSCYARDPQELKENKSLSFIETIREIRPTVLIGTSGTPNTFSKEVVELMASINERPIIFPLSNPTSKSECTASDAINWSQGRAIVATGSPFAPVEYKGKKYRIGQCNNSFIFPGVGLGLSFSKTPQVTNSMFLAAARALAATVSEEDIAQSCVFPPMSSIRECSLKVACATVEQVVAENYAPAKILENLEEALGDFMWEPHYLPILNDLSE